MKKIILLVLFFLTFLYSVERDEHKVDLYYANGIMMIDKVTFLQKKLIET